VDAVKELVKGLLRKVEFVSLFEEGQGNSQISFELINVFGGLIGKFEESRCIIRYLLDFKRVSVELGNDEGNLRQSLQFG